MNWILQRAGLVTSLIAVTVGCGPESQSQPSAVFDTLSTGIVHVSNPIDGALPGTAWRFGDPVVVGGPDGTGPDVFGQVTDFDVDRNHRIYVLDRFAQAVQIFDSIGAFVGTIGGPGRGPGEFAGANGIAVDPADRLWVFDQVNQRYTLFDTDRTLVAELPRRGSSTRSAEWINVFSVDGQLSELLFFRRANEVLGGRVRYDLASHRLIDTLPMPSLPAGTPLGWGHRILTANGWWIGIASEYRLYEVTARLDTVRIVDREYSRLPMVPATRDSMRDQLNRVRNGSGNAPNIRIPVHAPLFEQIVIDDAGFVWVLLSPSTHMTDGSTFDVFEPAGRYLGSVSTLFRVQPRPVPIVRGDRVVFMIRDDLDVESVVMLTVTGRGLTSRDNG